MSERKKKLRFLREFIKSPTSIGAVAPSSPRLVAEMLAYWPVGHKEQKVIVEYGPGTGAITRGVLSSLKDEHFMAMEIHPPFVESLRKEFPNLDIYEGSAEELSQALSVRGYQNADLIVSGLPWATFPDNLQKGILHATIENLNDKGVFSTFAYIHALRMPRAKKFKKQLETAFPYIEISKVVWKNLPPAIVYHCHKQKKG